ncbi:flavohemoprotein [Macrococcus equipercicus]|uniref:nitric oxide dioxygenase n=1 Tax=Macrococcus equipercicus TaxID=69967 RepID=A0ABQ6RBS7_9STAP|nr:globin domain-containing protein [Macrococcus equipercicus]KAA1042636.1 flavohemoprotein [Macrococcus equipercicus]
MLSQQTREIIKATVPVLEQHGQEITTVFYAHLFEAHPELLNIFNKTNQQQGRQQAALAQTVLAAAKHIDHLEAIVPNVNQIAHKHRALQVKAEHYPIVGEHLIYAIKEVLGDAATPDIIAAWTEAYGEIADVFIQMEKALYEEEEWHDFKPFKVTAIKQESAYIKSFTVTPVNDMKLKPVVPGQYITVKVQPEDEQNDMLRHYSICTHDITDGIQFAVKRDVAGTEKGIVSNYLHDKVTVGDELLLSAPAGEFTLQPADQPLVFLSGGVGMTPLMAMLQSSADKQVSFIHSAYNRAEVPFKDEITAFHGKENIQFYFNYSEEAGRLTADKLRQVMTGNEAIYMCGSVSFMESMLVILDELGIDRTNIHFEPFGPKMSITA